MFFSLVKSGYSLDLKFTLFGEQVFPQVNACEREILCGLAVRVLIQQMRGIGFESHQGIIPFSVSK